MEMILSGCRTGQVQAPSSKSQLHRLLILAALSDGPVTVFCTEPCDDVLATAECLGALGAKITRLDDRFEIRPIGNAPAQNAQLNCRCSGSTLRFLLPVVGALGASAELLMEPQLAKRPTDALILVLRDHGMHIERRGCVLSVRGQLQPGRFEVRADISSQYVTGLLLALPFLDGDSRLALLGKAVSAPYVEMTKKLLETAGLSLQTADADDLIPGRQRCHLPEVLHAEGDWSGAAAFLCMGALSPNGIFVNGLQAASGQADEKILTVLERFGAEVTARENGIFVRRKVLHGISFDCEQSPDLVPVIAALASLAEGESILTGCGRLRFKESDRLQTVTALLSGLGAEIYEENDALRIRGRSTLRGGAADAMEDHRIAMAAAVAACGCREPVKLTGWECVRKSFPDFRTQYERLQEEPI